MKTERNITVTILKGDRDFVRGRIVGIVEILAGRNCFIEPITDYSYDEAVFTFEATDDAYKSICDLLNELLAKREIATFIF